MAGQSTSVVNIIFVWLDESHQDFERVRESFCKKTPSTVDDWKFLDTKDKCTRYIQQIDPKQKLVWISSGRLAVDMIDDLHNFPQIHSIYIYCRKKDKYESLQATYEKVRGIFDNPIQLDDRMYCDLEEEIRRPSSLDITTDLSAIPHRIITRLHSLWRNELQTYFVPDISWCIWHTNGCKLPLPSRGQGTIEFWLREPIPFELCLSNKQNLNENTNNSFAVVLKIDTREGQLGTVTDQHERRLHVRDSTIELHQILQVDDGEWHCYWLTLYSVHRMVQYGRGEVRPKFKILEVRFEEAERASLGSIAYLHIKLNHTTDINAMEQFKHKFKIFIGKEPIIFDPPLIIISPNEYSPTCPVNNYGILAALLPDPLLNLYNGIINFTLRDDTFPNLIETIERSIRSPNGWCYRKLREKINEFGKSRIESTYLSLSVNRSSLIKIWPPGHYSPIHHHQDAYSVIRILHGKILIKYFPTLSLHLHPNSPMEQLFEKDSVTWMMPKLNQTHQIKNPDMYGSCCITIESFQYETDAQALSECFRYITHDNRRIENHQCTPDDTYQAFKRTMQIESMSENVM